MTDGSKQLKMNRENSLDRDIDLVNTSQSDSVTRIRVEEPMMGNFVFHSSAGENSQQALQQKRNVSKAKIGTLFSGNNNNGPLDLDQFDKIIGKSSKTMQDPTEEYKMGSDNNSIFERQGSSDGLISVRRGSGQAESAMSKDPYEKELMATLKKQEKQILQNQLDVIEEEIEESQALDQNMPGFSAVIRKIEQKPILNREEKTIISGNQFTSKNDAISLLKAGSKLDRESNFEAFVNNLPKIGEKFPSMNKDLKSRSSHFNPERRSTQIRQEIQSVRMEEALENHQSMLELKAADSDAELEKHQLGLMGFNNLLFGNLITINLDTEEKCFKMLPKKATQQKITKQEFNDEEYDTRCLFRVIPQSQYFAQQKIESMIEQKFFSFNAIQREYDALMAEGLQNKNSQNSMMGSDVKYWTEIQIVHEDSKRFLCIESIDASEISKYYDSQKFLDTDIKALSLTNFISKTSHFKLVPTCNFQSEGSGLISSGHYFYILYTDQNSKEFYLYDHPKASQMIFTESYKTPFRFDLVRESVSFNEPKNLGNSHVIILTSANQHTFMNVKMQGEQSQSNDKSGGKSSSLPSFRRFYPFDTGNGKMKSAEDEKMKLDVKIRLDRYEDIQGVDLFGFWIVEPDDAETELKIKLKNFMTGQYLTTNSNDGQNQQSLILTNEQSLDCRFEIKPVNKKVSSLSQIDSSLIFKLRSCPINIGSYHEPLYLRAINSKEEQNAFSKTIQAAAFKDAEVQRSDLYMRSQCQLNRDDTFKFVYPDDQEFQEINFCSSSMQILNKVLMGVSNAQGLSKEKFNVITVASILEKILKYCTNKMPGMTIPKQEPGHPVPYRQLILKRIGLLDFLIAYLQAIDSKQEVKPDQNIISKKDQKQWQTLVINVFKLSNVEEEQHQKTLMDLIFQLIYNIVRDQPSFKGELQSQIDVLQQFVFVNEAPRVLIEILHEDLISLNRKEIHAISEPIKIFELEKYKPLIDFFIQTLQPSNRKRRYLYLLRKICIQDERPLPLVQGYIYQKLINDYSQKGKLLQIKESNGGDYEVIDDVNQAIYTLSDFDKILKQQGISHADYSRDKKTVKLMKFLLEQLDLMADLCRGRHKENQGLLRLKFKFESLMGAIENPHTPRGFKAKFIKLISAMYIDCEPNHEVQYSRVLCCVTEEYKQNSIRKSQNQLNDNQSPQVEQLISFVNNQLLQLESNSQIGQIEMEVLSLCQNLFRFGLLEQFAFANHSQQLSMVERLSDYIFFLMVKVLHHLKKERRIKDIDKLMILALIRDSESKIGGLMFKTENQVIERELSQNNPVDKSTLDIRNQLLNIKEWVLTTSEDGQSDFNNSRGAMKFSRNIDIDLDHSFYVTIQFLQPLQENILVKIIDVLHLFIDVRQNLYLQNTLRVFEQEAIQKLKEKDMTLEKVKADLAKAMIDAIPVNLKMKKNDFYNSKISLISLKEFYSQFLKRNQDLKVYVDHAKESSKELNGKSESVGNEQLSVQIPKSFNELIMQIFNINDGHNYIQQMSLSLISRVNSVNSEYFRNLSKSLLILDNNNMTFFRALGYQLNLLFQKLQKSNIWVTLKSPINKQEFDDLYKILKKFKKMFYYEQEVIDNTYGQQNDFQTIDNSRRRRTIKLYQNMFRSLKGYDILLNYIQQNKKNLIYLMCSLAMNEEQWASENPTSRLKRQNLVFMRKIYKNCFQILEGFTKKNKVNQSLMWKYKEYFIFSKLKSIPQIGELNFVHAIIHKNIKVQSSRDLETFVQKLNLRMDNNQENTAVLLDIYNSLIVYHDLPYVKKAVLIALDINPQIRSLHEKQDPTSFQTGIIVLEILANLLQNDSNGAISEILKRYFSLARFISYKNDVSLRMEEYARAQLFYEEKLEEMKDKFLCNYCIVNFFMFLNDIYHDDQQYQDISNFFRFNFFQDFMQRSEEMMNKLKQPKHDEKNLHIPEIKYFLYYSLKYIIIPVKSLQQKQTQVLQMNLMMSRISLDIRSKIGPQVDMFETIDTVITQMRELLQSKQDESLEIKNLLKFLDYNKQTYEQMLLTKNIQADIGKKSQKIVSGRSLANLKGDGSQDSLYNPGRMVQFEMNQMQNYGKIIKQSVVVAIQEQHNKQIKGIWKDAVRSFTKNKENKQIVLNEMNQLGESLLEAFLDNQEKQRDQDKDEQNLLFLYNLIDYFTKCEKQPWTLYNIIFGLNVLRQNLTLVSFSYSYIQDRVREITFQRSSITVKQEYVNAIFNSQINFRMIINSFNDSNDLTSRRNDVYSELIKSRLLNYMCHCDQVSMQQRLMDYFTSDKLNEMFFQYIYQYFSESVDKINKKIMLEKYQSLQDPESLSNKVFYHQRVHEKELLQFLIMFTKGQNQQAKSILRKQPQNNRSYNIIHVVFKYFITVLKNLAIPTFLKQAVDCLIFFQQVIQDFQNDNRVILIDNGFFQYAKAILNVEYHCREEQVNQALANEDPSNVGMLVVGADCMTNLQISTLKNLTVDLLLKILENYPYTHEVYQQFRREFSPETFRQLFSEFGYFFKNFHQANFTHELLFNKSNDRTLITNSTSGYFVKISFTAYFLLRKLKRSMKFERDEFYEKSIIRLMPEQIKQQSQRITFLQKLYTFLTGYFFFIRDLLVMLFKNFKKLVIKSKVPKKVFETDESISMTMKTMEENSCKIEIIGENGQLQQVYFIRLPFCKFKSDEEKESFLRKVDRTNPQTKVEGLMQMHHQFIRRFKQDHNIKKIPGLSTLSKYLETWETSSFILSFIINFLILSSFYQNQDSNGDYIQEELLFGSLQSYSTIVFIEICGYLLLFNTCIIFILQAIGRIPIYIAIAFHPEKYQQFTPSLFKSTKQNKFFLIQMFQKTSNALFLVTTDYLLMYNMICVIFTILGLRLHPFYFTFHISYIIITSSTLFNVLKSIIEPGFRLIMTIVFFLMTEYLFVVISFTYFKQDYPANNCDNMVRCFLVTIDQTFKSGGSVGGFLTHAYEQNGDTTIDANWIDYGRIAYDNFFNFFINILIIQMIAGIIIDKFGALREEDDLIQRDSANVCFICGRSKEVIDKVYEGQGGFQRHITFEHNMWNYVFYCAYLYDKKKKARESLNNQEIYLLGKIQSFDNTWMPAYYNYKD